MGKSRQAPEDPRETQTWESEKEEDAKERDERWDDQIKEDPRETREWEEQKESKS